ncbi:hypothetical protein GCM10022286_18130 [Gryllotalpicola daejeonensis]|uniref:Glycosyltransferase n=1 Tax=Gryllotalpicola daejeonensis TaxID=993087 RepID=A0ABP7ZK51_9MICO
MSAALVVVSLEPWDDIWRRNQYLVDGLLRAAPELEVLFVEPAADPVHDALSRRAPRRGAGLRQAEGYGGRLRLLQPTKPLPRVAGPVADAALRAQLRAAVRRLGWTSPVLWINDPLWAQLVTTSGWPSLYDMTDDWVEASRSGRENARLREADELLLRTAGEVVVCSTGLEASRGRVRPVHLVPNAVDVARYRVPAARPADLPAGAVALYAGTLHEDRLDVELAVRTGRALHSEGAALVFVGPNALSAENSARLGAEPGIHVLGGRPFRELPAYLQHADVLVVPHLVDRFTDSLDPLKLYEYQAVGRPIVSTAVAGFRDAAGVVISGADAFPDAVTQLVAPRRDSIEPGEVADWASRVADLAEIISGLRAGAVAGASLPA